MTIWSEDDRVVLRGTLGGTHSGEFMGIEPTGKSVTLTAMALRRIAGGKIAEEWVETDMLGLMQQMGVAPPATREGR